MTARGRSRSRHTPRATLTACLLLALCGCSSTLDSLGSDRQEVNGAPSALRPLAGPTAYANAFHDLLGKSEPEIASKIAGAFGQLFHGDAQTQAFYVPVGADEAYIEDVLHGDVRTEGVGLGMMIAVELDKRDEFDRLWTYAKAEQELIAGPQRGYFTSVCDDATACLDPYGMEQFVTALLFANDRWNGGGPGSYQIDAGTLLDRLQNKERENGGVRSGITSVFDPTTALVREQPVIAASGYTRVALEIPAVYELWARATGNTFWTDAAAAARAHLTAAANGTTGLWPQRSYFDASPVPGFDTYGPQGYRSQLNLALDALWGTANAAEGMQADRLLGFFTAQGLDKYGKTFELDGTVLDATYDQGLVAANGALAVASARANRADFANAVWAMPIPSGDARYYDGLLYLVSLLVLSGQYRVY